MINDHIRDVLFPYYSEICKSRNGTPVFSHMIVEIEKFNNSYAMQ